LSWKADGMGEKYLIHQVRYYETGSWQGPALMEC
jgi:hypothetical protein